MKTVLKLAKQNPVFRKMLIEKLSSSHLIVNKVSYPSMSFHDGAFLIVVPKGTFHLKQWVNVDRETFEVSKIQSSSLGDKVTIVPLGKKIEKYSNTSMGGFGKEEWREILQKTYWKGVTLFFRDEKVAMDIEDQLRIYGLFPSRDKKKVSISVIDLQQNGINIKFE